MAKGFIVLLILIAMMIGLVLAVSDSKASIADTSLPDNEATSSQSGESNSSASATITITMPPVYFTGEE